MWIEEPAPGKFRARWRQDGKRTPAAGPTFASRELALSWAETQRLLPTRDLRLAEVIDQWRDQEPSDYRREASAILGELALRQGWVRVADITPAAIALWQQQAGTAKREKTGGRIHVARYQQYLLGVLRWAHRVYKVPVDPDVLTLRRYHAALNLGDTGRFVISEDENSLEMFPDLATAFEWCVENGAKTDALRKENGAVTAK